MSGKKDEKNYDPTAVMEALADGLLLGNASDATRSRADLISWGLKSYEGQRDVWNALGYILEPTYQIYDKLYERGDIAATIINAMPDECWRLTPSVVEAGKKTLTETDFEKRWKELAEEYRFFHYLHRADRISGIGEFGVIWLGFDKGEPNEPLREGSNITFLRPLARDCVEISKAERDVKSSRYGLPEMYSLTISDPVSGSASSSRALDVHHSRILHIAEDCKNNDIFGTPRLKTILNRLHSLEMLAGGSAEMFWRGAFPGMVFNIDPDVQKDNSSLTEAREHIDKFVHNLQRYMRLKGITVQSLSPEVANPRDHFDVQIALIAAAKGYPQRILVGSERGELASTQDESAWAKKLEGRRINYLEPFVLRKLVNKLIEVGSLPEPAGGYTVNWPDMREYSPKVKAETENLRATALYNYVRSPDAQAVMPPEMFLRKIMGFNDAEVEAVEKIMREMKIDEDAEADRDSDADDELLKQKLIEITPEEQKEE